MHASIAPTNFLHHLPQQPPTSRRRRVMVRCALGILVIAVIIGSTSAAWSLSTIARHGAAIGFHLVAAKDALRAEEWGKARNALDGAAENADAAHRAVRPWVRVSWVPLLGAHVTAVRHLLDAATHMTNALQSGTTLAEDLAEVVHGKRSGALHHLTTTERRLLLERLFRASPDIRGILANVQFAQASLTAIRTNILFSPVAHIIREVQEQTMIAGDALTRAIPLFDSLPLFAGYPKEQRYLFLFQNNDELRPTGGFIGTYGILVLRDGDVVSLTTDNIYRIDWAAERRGLAIPPPSPIARYLNTNNKWFLRDANWSPDFPTAAKTMLDLYRRETNDRRPIDGVIAMTPTLIERLLTLVGPITVDGETFTTENFVDVLEYQVEKGFEAAGLPDIERKKIVGTIAQHLVEKMFALPIERVPDLLRVADDALRERDVQIFATDSHLQEIVQGEGWDGGVEVPPHDFLMLVDANLRAGKTDGVMERSIAYRVEPAGDRLRATATITYQHLAVQSWKTTTYRSYTRLFVPKGSTLLHAKGFRSDTDATKDQPAEVLSELGTTVFAGLVRVAPTKGHVVELTYLLPETITPETYALTVRKQAGTGKPALTVTLPFATQMREVDARGRVIREVRETPIRSDLRIDRTFTR